MGSLVKSYLKAAYANFDVGVFGLVLAVTAGALFVFSAYDGQQVASVSQIQAANAQCPLIETQLNGMNTPLSRKNVKEILSDCLNRDEARKALMLQRSALGNSSTKANAHAKKDSNE
jgi:hypothetical protein